MTRHEGMSCGKRSQDPLYDKSLLHGECVHAIVQARALAREGRETYCTCMQRKTSTVIHTHRHTLAISPNKLCPLALHFTVSLCMKSHSQLRRALRIKREGINKQANCGMHATLPWAGEPLLQRILTDASLSYIMCHFSVSAKHPQSKQHVTIPCFSASVKRQGWYNDTCNVERRKLIIYDSSIRLHVRFCVGDWVLFGKYFLDWLFSWLIVWLMKNQKVVKKIMKRSHCPSLQIVSFVWQNKG